MIKKELLSFIKSRRCVIITAVICLCVMADAFLVLLNSSSWEYILHSDSYSAALSPKQILHPAKAAFLSGSSRGHLMQIIITHLMPLFALLLGSDSTILERDHKYGNIMLTHISRKKYIKSKYISSFIIPFAIMLFATLLNLLAVIAIFHGGKSFSGLEQMLEQGSPSCFFKYELSHPYTIYILYMLSSAFASGICGLICRSITLLAKKYSVSYFVSFFVWEALIICKFSVTFLYQPFSEYEWPYLIAGHAILLSLAGVLCAFSYKRGISEDEL